jgi:GAF domain-containing protein
VVIPGLDEEERVGVKVPLAGHLRQALSVPMRVRGQIVGVMNFCGGDSASFSGDTVRLLNLLASIAALAMENTHLYQEADARARLRRQLLAREIKVQEEERRRIARELHDEVGQSLTGLIMSLDALEQTITTDGREQGHLRRYLAEAREIASGTLKEIRRGPPSWTTWAWPQPWTGTPRHRWPRPASSPSCGPATWTAACPRGWRSPSTG